MSDILLSVGLQTGTAETSQIQNDLDKIIAKIDKNPPKVKVGLQVDQSAIDHFKSQLTQIVNSVGLSSGAPITVNISGIGEITAQATTATKAINEMKTAAGAAQSAAEGASKKTAKNITDAKRDANELAKAEGERQRLLRKSTTLLTQMQDAERNWTKASKGNTKEQYAGIKSYISQVKALQEQYEHGAIDVKTFGSRVDSLSTSFVTARSKIKEAGEATKTLSGHFGSLVEKFSSWLTVTQVFMMVVRSIKKMVGNVIELDTAMTELKKVTSESEATYNRFLSNATVRAKQLGVALTDVVNATADFARLGYGVEDASKLADAALVYKNVGDGIKDINQASESIISTMQAFQINPDDVMRIVDVFNSVGNAFAVSSGGIGEALKRSAASMQAAGNTLEETAALVAAANTVVQDPEKVGTVLKTASMFLRAAKTEAEEAGESTEGMAKSVSELREELLALTGQRVDIQIDENTFKSTYQILKELSQVWDELTDISQANILEMVGGKRNSNAISAIVENFEIAEEALRVASTSAGSALKENDVVLESIQGKLNQFAASWQALSNTLVNNNLVKVLVDIGTALLDVINKVAEFTGSFGTVLISIYAFAGAYKKFEKFRLAIDGLKISMHSLVGGAKRRPFEYAHYTVVVTLNEP